MSSGLIFEMQNVVTGVIKDEHIAKQIVFALISNFGGCNLHIPSNNYETRNREINELHHAGASVEQLSIRYRLSKRTIYRILEN